MKDTLLLREDRSISEMITFVFAFVKQNLKNLLKLMVVYVLPWALVSGVCMGMFYSELGDSMVGGYSDPSPIVFVLLIPFLLGSVMSLVSFHTSMSAYMHLYLTHTTEEITSKLVFATVKRFFFRQLGTVLFWGTVIFSALFAITVGSFAMFGKFGGALVVFLCYLALIYVFVAMSLFPMAITVEDKSFIGAVTRSFQLVNGKWWHTFGFFFLIMAIQGGMSYVVMIPLTLASGFGSIVEGTDPAEIIKSLSYIFPISSVINSFLLVFFGVGLGTIYYSLVEYKEEVGLKERIEQASQEEEKSQNESINQFEEKTL